MWRALGGALFAVLMFGVKFVLAMGLVYLALPFLFAIAEVLK